MSDRSSELAHPGAFDATGPEAATDQPLVAPFDEDLWLDRLARRVGFGRLSRRLPGDVPPSYLFAVVLVGTIVPTVNAYAYLAGDPVVYVENPLFVLQPLAIVGGVFGARALRRRYHRVTQEMRIEERTDDPEPLLDIVPTWLPWVLFGAALLQISARVWALGGFSDIYREGGLTLVIGWGILNPLWSALAVQFVAVYLSIEIIAPWRLYRSDIGIDFLDPEGLGGLRPLGELVKHAYYYMVAGLIAFALVVYGPVVSAPSWGPTATTSIVFTLIWLGTVVTVAFAVFVLHQFMREEKRRELHRLDRVLRETIDNPWDIKNYDVNEEKQTLVDELRQRTETVSNTREYPATFSIWSQLLVSIVLPKAVQLLLARV
jgi:ABC-type multidrug transport system fused ATPase/permease subunit